MKISNYCSMCHKRTKSGWSICARCQKKHWIDQYGNLANGTLTIDYDGAKRWWLHGKFHRLDGPAVENSFVRMWVVRGKYHRLDGPAIEYRKGSRFYYINGEHYLYEEWKEKVKEYEKNKK